MQIKVHTNTLYVGTSVEPHYHQSIGIILQYTCKQIEFRAKPQSFLQSFSCKKNWFIERVIKITI